MHPSSPTLARRAALLVAALPLVAESAVANHLPDSLPRPPAIDAMKRAYLDCERAAAASALDTGGIMSCSILYEALKSEAFGGSFGALRRWYELEATGREGAGT